jgi:drug/metabolite transporter (DMT)-like permease
MVWLRGIDSARECLLLSTEYGVLSIVHLARLFATRRGWFGERLRNHTVPTLPLNDTQYSVLSTQYVQGSVPSPSRLSIGSVLALSILGISVSGPLVRLSAAAPLAIAVWRLAISLVMVGGVLLWTGGWRQWRVLDKRGLALAAGAGVMLALHFWTWITSIGMTTVAASVVLVNLQPAFVAGFSAIWLHERPNRGQVVGIAVAMLGALVVAAPDLMRSGGGALVGAGGSGGASRALIGDGLALAGAVTAALYFTSGRRLRRSLDVWPYVGLVYSACLVTLLALSAVFHVHLSPQPPREIAIFVAIAVGPMMLGHTGMNWSLKYVPAYVANVAWLGEPVGATLLAATLPGIRETPAAATFLGGALILAGVYVTSRRAAATVDG